MKSRKSRMNAAMMTLKMTLRSMSQRPPPPPPPRQRPSVRSTFAVLVWCAPDLAAVRVECVLIPFAVKNRAAARATVVGLEWSGYLKDPVNPRLAVIWNVVMQRPLVLILIAVRVMFAHFQVAAMQ